MTNLTQTSQLLKKIGPFLLIIGIIGLLLVGIFYRYQKPAVQPTGTQIPIPSPQIKQNPAQKQPGAFDHSQVEEPQIPQNLPVYSLKKYDLTEQMAKSAALIFVITNDPFLIEPNTHDGKQYNWQQEDLDLTLSETTIRFEKKAANLNTQDILLEEALQRISSEFVQKNPLLDKDLVANLQKTQYLRLENERFIGAGTFASSQIVQFFYDKKLSDYPLIGNSPDILPTIIKIQKNGEIISLSARFFKEYEMSGTAQLKSSSEAIGEIKTGKGKVVQTLILDQYGQAVELFRVAPVDVRSARINKISLVYFLPPDTGDLIQPIFNVEGKFDYNDGESGKITIYLPAVKFLTSSKP